MTKDEVLKILGINQANYPNFYKNMSKNEVDLLATGWTEIFADYPAELINGAFMECLKYCKFPVTVADIFDRLKSMRKACQKPVEVLWQEFLKAIREFSYLASGFRDTLQMEGQTKTRGQLRYEKATKQFEQLDSKIIAYVGDMGRLISFGKLESSHLEQVIFPAFRRSVEGFSEREEFLQITGGSLLEMVGKNRPKVELIGNETNYNDIYKLGGG